MRTLFARATIVAVALLAAGSAAAQVTTAVVTVHVRGGADSVSGVEVRLTPVGTAGRVWSGPTDASGRVTFPRVDAGPYRIELPAAADTFAAHDLDVSPGEVVTIDVDRDQSDWKIAQRSSIGYRSTFTQSDLALVPSSANVWSLIETAAPLAFSDRMDTGGISTGEPALLGSHASSWTQAGFFFGGVNVTSEYEGGTPLLYPDVESLAAVSIGTPDAPVDVGGPGPAIAFIPAAPGTSWHVSLLGELTPVGSRVRTGGGPPSLQTLRSFGHANMFAGGPAGPHTGVTVSLTSTRSTHTELDQPMVLPGDVDSANLGLLFRPLQDRQLDVHAGIQRTVHPSAERARLQDRAATADDRFLSLTGAWKQGHASPFWIDGGVVAAHKTDDALSMLDGTIERLNDAPVPQLTLPMPVGRSRLTFDAGFSPAAAGFDRGRHAFMLGANLAYAGASTTFVGNGPIGELVDGIPARAWVYSTGSTHPHATTAALFASDRYSPANTVTIDMGLRLELLRAGSGAGTGSVSWTNAVPRLSLRWAASSLFTFFGGYRRYDDELPLVDLAYGDPSAPQGSVYRWQDPNGDGLVEPSELGTLIARVGPGSAGGLSSIDPHLARPYVHEVELGFDARLGRTWTLRMAGVATHERRLIGLTDPGVTHYDVTTIFDPGLDLGSTTDDQELPVYARPPSTFGQDRYLLTNPPGLDSAFNGLELVIEGTAGRVHTLFGATATRSHGSSGNRGYLPMENDQGLPGELLVDPNATTNADGRLFFERGYSLKWLGTYVGPRGFRGAIVARYEDGQNFARLVVVPDLPQGPEIIRAYPNGRSKFTFTMTVDGHLEKGFAVGRGELAAILEAYNLLNTSNEVEEDVVTGPAFRTSTALQPPRIFRAGLRFQF